MEKSDLEDLSMMDSLYQSNFKWGGNNVGKTEKKQNSVSSNHHLESVKEQEKSPLDISMMKVKLQTKFKQKKNAYKDFFFNSPPKMKTIRGNKQENDKNPRVLNS